MKTDDLDQTIKEALSGNAPEEIHRNAQHHFEAFAARLREMPARRTMRERHPLWWLWSGLGLAGTATAAVMLFSFFFSPSVSWAQVVERFRALRFFNATVYFSRDSTQPPEKLEIWATQDRRTRVHYRGLIFFGQGDKPAKVLRAETGEEVPIADLQGNDPDGKLRKEYPALPMALGIHKKLGETPNFSLDELLAMFSGKRQDLQPVPNMDASIANDMQVFDLASPRSPEWMRFWVLKKSGLLTRLRSLDPDSGEQIEAVFDYFTAMPDEAFDPAKVQAAIRKQQGNKNKLYALLKDPGGRPLTPGDVFDKSGYHLPHIESAGRTDDGILWVMSSDSINHSAEGGSHYGWGRLTDDLGQKYLHEWVGENGDDRELEYYVPLDYRTGYKKPASYILTCLDRDEYTGVAQHVTIIGSVEVKEWKENAPVPKLYDKASVPGPDDFLRRLLPEICSLEDWERFDQLVATIPGRAEENTMALFRDIIIVRKLEKMGRRDEAAELRARLFPIVENVTKESMWEASEIIDGHICDLVRAGQRDTARQLANKYLADLSKPGWQSYLERLIALLHEAGMKETDIRGFFDQDVLGLPEVKIFVKETQLFQNDEWNPATNPQLAAWRAYLATLAARYNSRPLPADLEFIDDKFDLSGDQTFGNLPLPGHPEYQVTYFPYTAARDLAVTTAQTYDLDPSLATLSNPSGITVKPAVCVYRTKVAWPQIWAAYLKRNNIGILEKSASRKVLVARYDGRKLPNCFEVAPLDGSSLGGDPDFREGVGGGFTTVAVLQAFAEALNHNKKAGDPGRTIIVNETGLPGKPGPNQSHANICLAAELAFWSGEAADKLAFKWFQDNFGITFHEEEREMKMLELQPANQPAPRNP